MSNLGLLRFTTAGSVDDGKSTLIGRLLYDSKSVFEDQLAAVKKASANGSNNGALDLSLLTDGLRAEREQKITIDVAYRYFATPRRKFIIADTPGHEQYTRNMATGASTAHLAIVLVDARKGVLPQSRRHAYIAWLLGIRQIVVAINKMDLVDFNEQVYESIRADFGDFAARLGFDSIQYIPLSALEGDNVVTPSRRTPWFDGPSLLEYLETAPAESGARESAMRFPVQYVIRPTLDFRGYAGTVASGIVRRGDVVVALPSGRASRVKSIVTFDGELEQARYGMAVTICLEDEIDISRGDVLAHPEAPPAAANRVEAMLVWMHAEALRPRRPYLVKHATQQTRGAVLSIGRKVDVVTLEERPADQLQLNEIAKVVLETHRPLLFDPYRANHTTGSFILIDPLSNATVAAGMIVKKADPEPASRGRITDADRYARWGHYAAAIWLPQRPALAYLLERRLFDHGCLVRVVEGHPEFVPVLTAAGVIVLAVADRPRAGDGDVLEIEPADLPASDPAAAVAVWELLENRGVIRVDEKFASGEGI